MAQPNDNGVPLSKRTFLNTITLETALSIGIMLVAVAVSWGALATKMDTLAVRIAEHVGDTQRHQPILEKQRMVNEQIDSKMAPLVERIHQLEITLSRVEANQLEVLRILGRRPEGIR